MGENTAIEWCDHTFNPWIGCTKVSPACDHCYAEKLATFRGWAEWGVGKPRKRTARSNWQKLQAWDKAARRAGVRRSVFCASLADWADPEVPEDWRRELFEALGETTNLDILLLTKRHALARRYLLEHSFNKRIDMRRRLRIGMTVENETLARIRLSRLAQLADDGWRTFVSYEPALGAVNWRPWIERGAIGWLIAGGESGPHARPAQPDWFRAARDACASGGVPFFFKQWGEHVPVWVDELPGDPVVQMRRVGKKAAGAMLEGRLYREVPVA
ncbi:DUF5131 family protein [Reyranella sp.]|uniref:DUF5131 family protein n=1 Tax=Reyranella sp. TaxID=1929291 RepID=UPI003D148FA8